MSLLTYPFLIGPSPIDQVTRLSSSPRMAGPRRSTHENAVAQMVAAAIEADRIRLIANDECATPNATSSRRDELLQAYSNLKKSISSATPAPSANASTIKRDFFGRPVAAPLGGPDLLSLDPGSSKAATKIWFKFNEGCTNAIRRPIKLPNLFPQV